MLTVLEHVEKFKSLGSIVNEDFTWTTEVKAIITMKRITINKRANCVGN